MSVAATGGVEPRKVELILAQLDTLPPLAPVATRILALTEDSHSNARQIVELIGTDPSLTTRVLSLLGRAEHGVRREAITVENAVRLLGFDAIRQLTLATKIMELFGASSGKTEADSFDRLEFWKHCLGVACASRRIAMAVGGAVKPEEAFVLGLLHDIGKDAIHATMPKSYARVLQKSGQTRAAINDVERTILGVDHATVGHRLAERWGLPKRLTECIWLHHHAAEVLPASVAGGKHVQTVQLADCLVREHNIGFSGNACFERSSAELAAALGLAEAERQAILESLAGEIEARAAWIGMEEITSSEVYLKALLRSAEELSTFNVALAEQNRRLERKSRCLAALAGMNRAVTPTAAVRDVCGAGADALRQAFGVSAVLVFVDAEDGRWVDIGLSSSSATARGEIIEQPAPPPARETDILLAVQSALGGTWINSVGTAFDALIDRYRATLGTGRMWLLPLAREQQWVGGAIFAAQPAEVVRLRGDAEAIEALSGAIALAVMQAQSQGAAAAWSEELAEVNRRVAAMQPELLRARTLETVVAMAAGAAHELNNPLAVISGRAQMLRNRATDELTRQESDAIAKQAQACSDIVTELMEFAQSAAPNPETISLREFLEGFRSPLIAAGLLDAASLSLEVPSDTPPVRFDRAQLGGVFRELAKNAVEATDPATRRLSIKASADLTEENIVVEVADNGRGMTAEVRNRAIDPFFSHRPAGRGRGLGLARVHRWLRQNGGSMTLESRPGGGTRVTLRLPAAVPTGM